jgi:SAM-dependent methyltransferase
MKQPYMYPQMGVAMTCRSFEEYHDMFQLNDQVLHRGPILDVASGASSFTAEARRQGLNAYAVDPLYRLSYDEISALGKKEQEEVTGKLKGLQHAFDWSYYGSLERHHKGRVASLKRFLEHYRLDREGEQQDSPSIYRAGSLPQLPWENESFSFILCSHFLFLYGQSFDDPFHLSSIRELVRLLKPGGELRIYPLVDLAGQPHPRLQSIINEVTALRESDDPISVKLMDTPFRFLVGANQVLSVQKK